MIFWMKALNIKVENIVNYLYKENGRFFLLRFGTEIDE